MESYERYTVIEFYSSEITFTQFWFLNALSFFGSWYHNKNKLPPTDHTTSVLSTPQAIVFSVRRCFIATEGRQLGWINGGTTPFLVHKTIAKDNPSTLLRIIQIVSHPFIFSVFRLSLHLSDSSIFIYMTLVNAWWTMPFFLGCADWERIGSETDDSICCKTANSVNKYIIIFFWCSVCHCSDNGR